MIRPFLPHSMHYRSALFRPLAGLLLLSIASSAHAQTPAGERAVYSDIPAHAWYEQAVTHLHSLGVLDASQRQFRPAELVTRAEAVQLVIALSKVRHLPPPARSSFDDVAAGTWFRPSFEDAAARVWIRGDANCYGRHPCKARPTTTVNRAEMAALLVRVFALPQNRTAPLLQDVHPTLWYAGYLQVAADHCLIQADRNGDAHPSLLLNRAAVVTMLSLATQHFSSGSGCPAAVPTEESGAMPEGGSPPSGGMPVPGLPVGRVGASPPVHHGHRGGNPHTYGE